MKNFLKQNGLSLVLFSCFLIFFGGQIATGFLDYNEDRREHGSPSVALGKYLTSGHFLEASAENWESEFLQMSAYVLLTAILAQKGSPESKREEKNEGEEAKKAQRETGKPAPGPVRAGGWAKKLYANSLSITLFILFLTAFSLHAVGGLKEFNENRIDHGQAPVAMATYLTSSRFWFESFQNWQSEFLSVALLIVLTIFLRQKSSPESKPVAAPHAKTGQ